MNIFHTELIKLKNTLALWLMVMGALFVPVLLSAAYLSNWQEFLPAPGVNPWLEYLLRTFNGCCFFLLGFILLIIGLVLNTEHQANGWKHLFTLPVSKGGLYFGKLILILSVVACFLLLYFLLALTAGKLLGIIQPPLGFSISEIPYDYILRFVLDFSVAIIPMIMIQFWVSFRVKNLIASLGFGLVGLVLGLMLKNWEYTIYLPYGTPFQMLKYQAGEALNRQNFYGVNAIYVTVCGVLSCYDFTRRFRG